MTACERNHCKSDIDDRTERETCTRGRWIAKVNPGPKTRYVDAIGHITGVSLHEAVVAHRLSKRVVVPQALPEDEPRSNPWKLAAARAKWAEGAPTREAERIKRQAEREATRDEKKRDAHQRYLDHREDYIRRATERNRRIAEERRTK